MTLTAIWLRPEGEGLGGVGPVVVWVLVGASSVLARRPSRAPLYTATPAKMASRCTGSPSSGRGYAGEGVVVRDARTTCTGARGRVLVDGTVVRVPAVLACAVAHGSTGRGGRGSARCGGARGARRGLLEGWVLVAGRSATRVGCTYWKRKREE